MSTAIVGTVKASVNVTETLSTGFLANVPLPVAESLQAAFRISGTIADECDLVHAKTYSFTPSTPQTIDLTTALDILGNTDVFARIRALLIYVKSTTDAATLTVGDAASNAWSALLGATGTITLRGSTANNAGFCLFVAPNTTGWTVDSTHKNLLMTPSAHTFDVDVVALGCSA